MPLGIVAVVERTREQQGRFTAPGDQQPNAARLGARCHSGGAIPDGRGLHDGARRELRARGRDPSPALSA